MTVCEIQLIKTMDMCLDDIGKMVTIVMLNATFNIICRGVLLVFSEFS